MSHRSLLIAASVLALVQFEPFAAAQKLSLSSATTSQSASLNLTLASSGVAVSGLQWTLQFPQGSVASISATAGAALTAAGKLLSCTAGSGSYACVAYGLNQTTISDGVVAVVSVTVTQNVAISVNNTVASSPTGTAVTMTEVGGSVTVPVAAPQLSSLACSPTRLLGSTASNCTVTLSAPTPQASSITLSSSSAAVIVPSSITVPANSTSGQFAAVSGGGSSGTANLTATLNGTSKTAPLTLASGAYSLRVNAGGGAYTDPEGLIWTADANFAGGSPYAVTNPIANTTTPALYQTCRWGAFTYTLPAPNGSYSVTLKFAETSRPYVGARQFNVTINGTQVLTNFDVFAQAGGPFRAVDRAFLVNVTDGQIIVGFSYGAAEAPMVSAIDVEPAAPGTPIPTIQTSTRVNAGGAAYTDSQGFTWMADADFTGGSTYTVTNPIANTTIPAVYQTCRWGAFAYTLPEPNGSYSVTLKFAETSRPSAGARQFNVSINGTQVLTNFDVFAQAGGAFIAVDRTFPVHVTDGQIIVGFSYGAAEAPMVSAIDVEPAAPGTPRPTTQTSTRVNAGGAAYTDSQGFTWMADADFTGGSAYAVTNTIVNTTTPALYQTCRWGAFSYTLAVPNGSYNVVLKFAEISRFSTGSRRFNVAINGTAVLNDFDIFAQAGGAFIALDKTFPVTVTGGQITITFSYGAADAPMVNAISIQPAS